MASPEVFVRDGISSLLHSMKPTVVIGASENQARYAHMAVRKLRQYGHPVRAIGLRAGRIDDVEIETERPSINRPDTVTLYVGPANQPAWEDYILSLRPIRIIFNPGTENPSFEQKAIAAGIHCEVACTLVLLSANQY